MTIVRGQSRAFRLALALALALLGAHPAAAAIQTVTNCGDGGAATQLRALIASAAAGDTILIPGCPITLEFGVLTVAQNLTLVGAGASRTSLNGRGVSPVLQINAGAVVTILGVTVTNGKSTFGGGIGSNGTLTLIDSAVSGNTAAVGGGINGGGTLTLINTTISGNTATFLAGGINSGGTLTVVNSTLADNHAPSATTGDGGALYNTGGTATLINTTISGNTSGQHGGGIYTTNSPATVSIINSTIAGNTAAAGGGGISQGPSAVTQVKNSILANNAAPIGSSCNGSGITSRGHNIDDGTSCGFLQASDLGGTNPLLGPLQNNGGPTQTHALLAGSPAIDAGDNVGCPSTDQRGVTRPQDGDGSGTATCDIGAAEFVFVPPPPPPNPLTILPPSGILYATEGFDLMLIVAEAATQAVVGGQLTLDGTDVTAAAAGCLIPGTLVTGGQTLRCPGLRGSLFSAGPHTLSVTLNLSDGGTLSNSVTWDVRANHEP